MADPARTFSDPRTNSVTLGPDSFEGRSITGDGRLRATKWGHAYQYAQGYAPMKIRGALVPVVNLASNAWMFLLLIGIVMQLTGLIDLAIILYAFAVLFQIVTLPVEFDASRRAMVYMQATGSASGGAKRRVQRAARLRAHLRRRCSHLHLAAAVAPRPASGLAGVIARASEEGERAAALGDALARARAATSRGAVVDDRSDQPLSVSAAMALAKGALEGVAVRLVGEVSEVSNKPGYKAVYFTVKDKSAALPCMMWNNRFRAAGVPLRVGQLVELARTVHAVRTQGGA